MAATSSAEVVPVNERNTDAILRDPRSLQRVPTLDEVPSPSANPRRGEVVVYSGVSFGASRNAYQSHSQASQTRSPTGPIERMELFTDEAKPGQVYARVMIIDEGSATPREALITPMIGVSKQDKSQLDTTYSLHDLVERANVELQRFFRDNGAIDSDVKRKEFGEFIEEQESMSFLLSNLVNRNKEKGFDLFSAYFSPGGVKSGVGVFLNTWL